MKEKLKFNTDKTNPLSKEEMNKILARMGDRYEKVRAHGQELKKQGITGRDLEEAIMCETIK